MVGLLKQNCQGLGHLTKLTLFLLLFGFLSTAQSFDSIRIAGAVYDGDNNLLIHLDISPDESVLDANLLLADEQLSLDLEIEPLAVEQWFILDTGISMTNSYSLITDELRRLSESANERVQFGGIIFAEEPLILDPSDSQTTLDSWLDSYQLTTGTQRCVLDALNDLPDIVESPRIARRIMLITGNNGETNACAGDIPELSYPLDIIIIGNHVDRLYSELVGQSGGSIAQTTVLGFAQEISHLEDTWNRPVIALSLSMIQTIDFADLVINLESGETFRQRIFPRGEVLIPPTATATATTISPTATATEMPATATALPQATDTATMTPISEATEELIVPGATETPLPLETIPDAPVSDSALIAGGGIAAVVVVLIVMALLLGLGRKRSQDKALPDVVDFDSTILPDFDEARLDRTQSVTMRQIASQLGPTLVANLVNRASDTIYEIHRPISILGRQIGSDILIAGNNQISREHLRFTTRDDGTIWIIRMTRNPILVNGLPMETTRQLFNGDMIQLSPDLQVMFITANHEEQES